jgi:hypothetical protein
VSAEASRRGLDPIETFQGAARQAPAAQRKSLRAVLAGFRDYRPEELTPLWQQGWLPERWIEAWRASLPELPELAELAEDSTASPAPGQEPVLAGKA